MPRDEGIEPIFQNDGSSYNKGTKSPHEPGFYGFYFIKPRAMVPGMGSARTLISLCLANTGYGIMSPQSGIENLTDT